MRYAPAAMSFSQIKYFVAVADEGHVGRAAKSVHIAQPALSRQIRDLEEELGTPLFKRTPKGMQLLPEGAIMLSYARTILQSVDEAVRAVRQSSCETRL